MQTMQEHKVIESTNGSHVIDPPTTDDDYYVVRNNNKRNNNTMKLNIKGVYKDVCKWDIKSKCVNTYCNNYHLENNEQLCTYYMKGYCSFDTRCLKLHINELYPYGNFDGKPPKGCKIITLHNNRICVCEKWIENCKLPRDQRKHASCNGIHSYNDFIFKHLNIPICEDYLNGNCRKRNCIFPHPIELNPISNIPRLITPYVVRLKKGLCVKHILHTYDPSNENCYYGNNCNYAHGLDSLDKIDVVTIIENYLENPSNKIPLQDIFNELYNCINTNINYINDIRKELLQNRISCPVPIPSNFCEFLNIWIKCATYARKENKTNKLGLFDGPDSEKEQIAWGLYRRTTICDEDLYCYTNHILGKKIHKHNICIHGYNCKKGSHISSYDSNTGFVNVICIDELSGKCKCDIKNGIQAIQKRTFIQKEIDKLKQDLIQYSLDQQDKYGLANINEIEAKIKNTNNIINYLTNKIVNTYCKIHLIGNYGYTPLKQYTKPIINKELVDSEFVNLPELSEEELVLLKEKNKDVIIKIELHKNKMKAQNKIIKFLNPFILDKLSKNLKSNIPRLKYIVSGAYKYMTLNKFKEESNIINLIYHGSCVHNKLSLLDFKLDINTDNIFIHWYKDQSIDFDMFYDDIKNKKYNWEELGIIKKQKKNVIEEYNIKSSKDNYFGFWSWYYKITFN